MARPVESQSPSQSQAKSNLPEINVQRCVRTYDKVRGGLRWRKGVRSRRRRLRQEIWNLLEVPTESACRIRRCFLLAANPISAHAFSIRNQLVLLFVPEIITWNSLRFFNANCQSKSHSIISRFHWGFCELCVFQIKWMRMSFMVCSTWESVCFNTQSRVAKDFYPREQPLTSYVHETDGETGKLE